MNKDYYNTLGVSCNATTDEIKKAYRKLALRYHPDRAGKEHEHKFKEASEAYQILSNPQKRAQYDQFGAAGVNAGAGGPRGAGFGGAEGFGGAYNVNFDDIFSGASGFGFGRVGDIFEDFFGQTLSQVQVEMPINLTQALLGDKVQFKSPQGEIVTLNIPENTQDGTTFRFSGKGNQHKRGRGDLLVTIRIKMPRNLNREQKELFEQLKQTGL